MTDPSPRVTPWITFGGGVLVIVVLYWAQAVLVPGALAVQLTFVLTPPPTLVTIGATWSIAGPDRPRPASVSQSRHEKTGCGSSCRLFGHTVSNGTASGRQGPYAECMSYVNALWLATAVWLVGVVAVVSVVGLSSWGVALMLFVGVAPLLVAHRLWSAQETTMSEDIQRQLR